MVTYNLNDLSVSNEPTAGGGGGGVVLQLSRKSHTLSVQVVSFAKLRDLHIRV